VVQEVQAAAADKQRPQVRKPVTSSRGRFRPRQKVVQQPINQSYLRNLPEAAAPEGGDIPMDEQIAIREALVEIKKEKRNRFY